MATPKVNTAYEMVIALTGPTLPGKFFTNPTIDAGDFKVSIDGGAFANLATLPVVYPAGGKVVKINLSAAEMNGAKVVVFGSDPDDVWEDVMLFIDVPQANEDELTLVRKIMQNKMITDPDTGILTIYDDDDSTVLLSCNIYEDALGAQLYRGMGAELRERLT